MLKVVLWQNDPESFITYDVDSVKDAVTRLKEKLPIGVGCAKLNLSHLCSIIGWDKAFNYYSCIDMSKVTAFLENVEYDNETDTLYGFIKPLKYIKLEEILKTHDFYARFLYQAERGNLHKITDFVTFDLDIKREWRKLVNYCEKEKQLDVKKNEWRETIRALHEKSLKQPWIPPLKNL